MLKESWKSKFNIKKKTMDNRCKMCAIKRDKKYVLYFEEIIFDIPISWIIIASNTFQPLPTPRLFSTPEYFILKKYLAFYK